jgi:cardiolipin synthase
MTAYHWIFLALATVAEAATLLRVILRPHRDPPRASPGWWW